MLKQIKFGILAILLLGFLASCNNDSNTTADEPDTTDNSGNLVQPGATPQQPGQLTAANNGAAATPTPPVGPTTTIQFEQSEYNFGKAKAGGTIEHDYTFTNTGKEPLIISNAKGSCGCTVPDWPKDPIAPGGTGKIKVAFDSKGKSGPQTKTVTISANTDPPNTIIYIKGELEGATTAGN